MRKPWLWILVFVCTAAAGLLAQDAAPRRFIAIGCVSLDTQSTAPGASSTPTPMKFILTETRGEKPAKYELDGNLEQLRIHTGHMVEVAGPLSPRTGEAGAASQAAGAPTHVLKVQSLTYLSTRCSK